MEGKLEDKYGKKYGDIGTPTCHSYQDGSTVKIGDRVKLIDTDNNRSCGIKYVVELDGETFIMGVKGVIFHLGCGTKDDNCWSIQKITDWSEIKNGDKDNQDIIARISEDKIEIPHKDNDLLYFITSKQPLTFEQAKGIEKMFSNNIVILNAPYVESAKMVNKRTGEVTDLMN